MKSDATFQTTHTQNKIKNIVYRKVRLYRFFASPVRFPLLPLWRQCTSVPVHSIHNECDISVCAFCCWLFCLFSIWDSFRSFFCAYLFEQTLWKSVCIALTQQMYKRRPVQRSALHTMCEWMCVYVSVCVYVCTNKIKFTNGNCRTRDHIDSCSMHCRKTKLL